MKTKEEILKEKAGIYQFTDNWTFEDDQKLIKAIHEAMDEYAEQFKENKKIITTPTAIDL
jgi:adenylosuccinate synthase